MEEKLHFSTIKEARGPYFVEYKPPISGFSFATLQLIYTTEANLEEVAQAMEREAQDWLSRFPVPVMVSAFDSVGDLIPLEGVRTENRLMAFRTSKGGAFEAHWRLLRNDEIPNEALSREHLLAVYSEVAHKTSAELKADADRSARSMKVGWYVVFLWAAVAPAAFLVLEYFGPQWLATLVFLYGVFRAAEKALVVVY